MALDTEKVSEEAKRFSPKFKELFDEIGKIIVGQKELVEQMVVALLADGHLLVEGLPGLAKTLAVNTLAKVTAADFKRIQFTPDLLPADLTGTTIYNQADGKFTVKKGPIFTNILLADEINRSPPKVQAALLEVMQERQVTIGGETYKTGDPFLVFATQNPIEQEGTYVLPEAQTDRFMMKLLIDYPAFNEERLILERMARLSNLPEVKPVISTQEILDARKVVDKVFIDEKILDYILKIVFATRTPESYGADIAGLLQFGGSPRASISLVIAAKARAMLQGRGYVIPEDIQALAKPILRHRVRLSYEAEAEQVSADEIIDRVLTAIPVP